MDGWESQESSDLDTDTSKVNLYELYLKGEVMPSQYVNEHQKFEAARQYMHKLQEAKNTQVGGMNGWFAWFLAWLVAWMVFGIDGG